MQRYFVFAAARGRLARIFRREFVRPRQPVPFPSALIGTHRRTDELRFCPRKFPIRSG
ncbi:MAG TPA: hypothetical protein VGG02_09030 [Chthoniobacterales bacterium]